MSAFGPLRHLVRRSDPVALGVESGSTWMASFGRF
jgi:hypothetical protein